MFFGLNRVAHGAWSTAILSILAHSLLAPGASVPLVLRLSNGTSLQIVALVRPLNAQ